MKKIAFALVLGMAAASASAAAAEDAPPALLVVVDEKAVPLGISKAQVEASVLGFLAETSVTLTFKNDLDRVLEGALHFPLPEGSTVAGFALDVGGELVEGSVVEREKARVVFEKEVRKGVDPGLVEWVKGSSFKTRVYPIPAKGTRTVRLKFVHRVVEQGDQLFYRLPLNLKDPVEEFSLKVRIERAAAEPKVAAGAQGGLAFVKEGEDFVASSSVKKAAPPREVSVELPMLDRKREWIEKDEKGDFYFAVFEPVTALPATFKPKEPKDRIVVLWDASSSRGKADHARELAILGRHLEGKKVPFDLVVFRNVAEKAERFTAENGGAAALIERLKKVVYDGGTDLSSIVPPPSPALAPPTQNPEPTTRKPSTPDYYLLFTDGLSTLGPEPATGFFAPVYAVNGDPSANHAFLKFLAAKTGGDYVNLGQAGDDEAASALGGLALMMQAPTYDPKEMSDLMPSAGRARPGRFVVCGRLLGDEPVIAVKFGFGTQNIVESGCRVKKSEAVSGTRIRTLWAQMKVEELSVFPEANEKELVELGKKHGLVTPGTSLLVLETADQYVEHGIVPPKSREKVYAEWEVKVEAHRADLAKAEQSKITRVLEMWKKRVEWWEKEFEYPADFKYAAPDQAKTAVGTTPSRDVDGVPESAENRIIDFPGPTIPLPDRTGASPTPGKNKDGVPGAASALRIDLKDWDPKTPYIEALKAAAPEKAFDVYLEQKKAFGASPAFFLDCADFFHKAGCRPDALQILTNVAELELDSAPLLRVLAHRLDQIGEFQLAATIFERVLYLRPEEPQSYRDLALVLAKLKQYERALGLLAKVVMGEWDRFQEIEVIALMELNQLLPLAKAAGAAKPPVDERLVKLLDVDLRIVLTWDADQTDIDLWIIEPSGEKAYYSHPDTTIGGHVSKDFTQGYGPEEYVVKKAMPGTYKIQCNYFGSRQQALAGPTTIQAAVFTNFGRPDEKVQSLTVRLAEKKDVVDIGEVKK